MRRDEFERHEQSARDVIQRVGRASEDITVPPHFAAAGDGQGGGVDKGRARAFEYAQPVVALDVAGQAAGGHGAGVRCCRDWRPSPSMPPGSRRSPPGFPRPCCIRRLSRSVCGTRTLPAPRGSIRTPRLTPPSRATRCTSWCGPALRVTCWSRRSRPWRPPRRAASGSRWRLRRARRASGRH